MWHRDLVKTAIVNSRACNPFLNHSINRKWIDNMLKEAMKRKRIFWFFYKKANPKKHIHENCPFSERCHPEENKCFPWIEKSKYDDSYYCELLNSFLVEDSPLTQVRPWSGMRL